MFEIRCDQLCDIRRAKTVLQPCEYSEWVKHLDDPPNFISSELPSAAPACVDAIDILLNSSPPKEDRPIQLSSNQLLVLETMVELNATECDRRKTTKEIVTKAEGRGGDPEKYKHPLADLSRWGLIEAMKGRNGGYWITQSGKEEIRVKVGQK